jgi:hypothetical protein
MIFLYTIHRNPKNPLTMKPDAAYITKQRELQILLEQDSQPGRRKELSTQLRGEFATAWHLAPDRKKRTEHLHDKLCRLYAETRERLSGLDHCTYYTGLHNQRVIVTQPYGEPLAYIEAELKRGLTLDDRMSPQVIPATEWAFYYPGHANLIILSFPFRYARPLPGYIRRALAVTPTLFDQQTALVPS